MTPKEWFCTAIVRMVIADDKLHVAERQRLKYALKHIQVDVDVNKILKMTEKMNAGDRKILKLEPLPDIDINTRLKMLFELARISTLDLELLYCEQKSFIQMAILLSFNRQFANEVLNWAKKLLELNIEEKRLFKIAKKFSDDD